MAVIDGMNINGNAYDLRDKVAVRFNEAQTLTDAQKAIGRGNIDAVALKQGAANAGKVLMVGEDGNVTVGDAVQIDDTLQQAGQAADAAAVGAALGNISDETIDTETITVDKSTCTKMAAYMTAAGLITTKANCNLIYFACLPGKTYTIRKVVSARFRVGYTTVVPASTVNASGVVENNTGTVISITPAANASYLVVYYYDGDNDTISESAIYNSIIMTYEVETTEVTAVDKVARDNSVHVNEAQNLTDAQKAQARGNIGSASQADVTDLKSALDNARHMPLRSYFYSGKANFLGDSITVNGPDPNHSYLFGVKDVLGLATVNNYGYSGSSLADNSVQQEKGNSSFCDRYLSMSDDADLIIVFGGVNDVWHGSVMGTDGDTTKTTVWGALYVLCNGLMNKYPTKTIVFVTPTKQNRVTGNMTCEDIAEAMKVMCKRYAIPVFDANSLSGIYPYNTDNADYYTRGDKLHLNAEGNARLGRMLGNFILSLFGTDSEKNTANGPFSYKEFDWIDGGYIRANGEIKEDSDYAYSKPIDISEYAGLGTLIFFTKVTTAGCVFDANNNRIGWIPSSVLEETVYTVPYNAAYMILNYRKSYGKEGCSWMFVDGAPESATYPYSSYHWTTGGYYNVNGYNSNDQYEYSEHINISAYAGRDIIINSSEKWAGVVYDSNDTLLSAFQMNPKNVENTFTVPSNAAYMILNANIDRGYNSLYWKFSKS